MNINLNLAVNISFLFLILWLCYYSTHLGRELQLNFEKKFNYKFNEELVSNESFILDSRKFTIEKKPNKQGVIKYSYVIDNKLVSSIRNFDISCYYVICKILSGNEEKNIMYSSTNKKNGDISCTLDFKTFFIKMKNQKNIKKIICHLILLK